MVTKILLTDDLLLKKKNDLEAYNLHTVIWVAAEFRWAFFGTVHLLGS